MPFPYNEDANLPPLPEVWADTLCRGDKQDVSLLLVGPKGAGKSYSALSICYNVALAIARRKGGQWTDYFPYDQETKTLAHVASINQKDIVELLATTKRNCVYLLDDASISMNSRRFMSNENIMQGDIWTTMRVSEAFVCVTVVDQATIDKTPRELFSWYGEIVEPHHAAGYNIAKIFRSTKLTRLNETRFIYPRFGENKRSRVTRVIIGKPPDFIADAYDILRERKTKQHREAKLKAYLAEEAGSTMGKREKKLKEDIEKWGPAIREKALAGQKPTKISQSVPLSHVRIGRIIAEMGIGGQ